MIGDLSEDLTEIAQDPDKKESPEPSPKPEPTIPERKDDPGAPSKEPFVPAYVPSTPFPEPGKPKEGK